MTARSKYPGRLKVVTTTTFVSRFSARIHSNIIKHAQASKAYLKLERTEKELILTVSDDGCGFASIKGDELHTVRDRVLPFSGEVKVISWKQPTEVQVRLAYKERT